MIELFLSLSVSVYVCVALEIDIANLLPSSSEITLALNSGVSDAQALSEYADHTLRLVNVNTPANDSLFADSVRVLLLDASDNVMQVGIDAREIPTISVANDQVELAIKSTHPNLFRIKPSQSGQGVALLELAAAFEFYRVVVIHDQSPFAASALEQLLNRTAALGVTVAEQVEVTLGFNLTAMVKRMTVASSAVLDSYGRPNDVGAFIYLGSEAAVFRTAWQAAAQLNITGEPYTWLLSSSAAAAAAGAGAVLPRGSFTLGAYATEAEYAHDAVVAAARAVAAASFGNDSEVAAALRALSFQGQSGVVAFDANQDRPAQFQVLNLQAAWRPVAAYVRGDAPLTFEAPLLFATGDSVAPAYPFARCESLGSCAECSAQPKNKCGWCAASASCSARDAAFGSRCGAEAATSCPQECVKPLPSNVCLFDSNMTIYSPHQARCQSVNGANGILALYREPAAGDDQCEAAFVAERGCQQLVQKLRCSSSCQACDERAGVSNPLAPRPVCRSTCDALIARHCAATSSACSAIFNTFFAAMCAAADTPACTNVTIEAAPLVLAGNMITLPPSTLPTTAASVQPSETLATVDAVMTVVEIQTETSFAATLPATTPLPLSVFNTDNTVAPIETQPTAPQQTLSVSVPTETIAPATTTTAVVAVPVPSEPAAATSASPVAEPSGPSVPVAPNGGDDTAAGTPVDASVTVPIDEAPAANGSDSNGESATIAAAQAGGFDDDDDGADYDYAYIPGFPLYGFGLFITFIILLAICCIAACVYAANRRRGGGRPVFVRRSIGADEKAEYDAKKREEKEAKKKEMRANEEDDSEVSSLVLAEEGGQPSAAASDLPWYGATQSKPTPMKKVGPTKSVI